MRYRPVDEPRPGPLQRFALPPFLVFLVATWFLPWGSLLMMANSLALNGPHRNAEIAFAAAPIVTFFGGIYILNELVRADTITISQANYLMVAAIGAGLVFACRAFALQHQTAELRRYLGQNG
jgi:hypothetical protein